MARKAPLEAGEYALAAAFGPGFSAEFFAAAMDISVIAFLALLLGVGLLRIFELRVSHRHQQQMIAHGATRVKEPRFRWIVRLHTAVLVGARPLKLFFYPAVFTSRTSPRNAFAVPCGNAVRLWLCAPMGQHWKRAGDELHEPRCCYVGAISFLSGIQITQR